MVAPDLYDIAEARLTEEEYNDIMDFEGEE